MSEKKNTRDPAEAGTAASAAVNSQRSEELRRGGFADPEQDKGRGPQRAEVPEGEELVDFTAPFDPSGEKQDILLSVNGETVRVQRGATVRLKRKFVQVWENANAQAAAARRTMEKARQGGKAPLLEM